MVKTRNSRKRTSPNPAENESKDTAEKKIKLSPKTSSKYFEKDAKALLFAEVKTKEHEVPDKGESSLANTHDCNESVFQQNSKRGCKIKYESDSDESSSDEFMKVPLSLHEIGNFETLKKETTTLKENNVISNTTESSDSTNDEKEEDGPNEYYDFSQIIQSQELISKTKKEQEEKANVKNSTLNNTKSKKQSRPPLKKSKTQPKSNIKPIGEELGISELLAIAEGSSINTSGDYENSDEEDSKNELSTEENYSFPEKGVEVTIKLPNLKQKKKSGGFDIEAAMKRRINLIKKENQVYMHKVHLLCWIAHGMFLNSTINNDDLMGLALSLIPSKHCYPPKHADLNYLEKLVSWFVNKLTVDKNSTFLNSSGTSLLDSLESQINSRVVLSQRDLVLIFLCMLRSLGINARLVISLRPVPLRPPASDLCQVKPNENKSNSDCKPRKSVDSPISEKKKTSNPIGARNKQIDQSSEKNSCVASSSKTEVSNLKTRRNVTAGKKLSKSEKSGISGIQSPYFSSSDEVPLKELISKSNSSKASASTNMVSRNTNKLSKNGKNE
ncbi:DNA repair protein complementing XP-C cells homolog [Homalodisca vitripennis]|uniref:DNA repair protein complementing XP-C cells homolog n=1 Tax=Homalodisca vitripennis TaxID=197043 RepID=UPI001EEB9C53|nr:DNA repair protein complementing XP-C cells homolog [Homalodisca vitripennis]